MVKFTCLMGQLTRREGLYGPKEDCLCSMSRTLMHSIGYPYSQQAC